jgi:hypothetical protein
MAMGWRGTMNFQQWLEAARGLINSTSEALQELGLSVGASKEEIMKAYRMLSLQSHPDLPKNKDKKAECAMRQKRLNSAHDWFRDNGYNSSGGGSRPSSSWSNPRPSNTSTADSDARARRERAERERERREREQRRSQTIPPWQTDERSTHNDVGSDFTNLNYCKKRIWQKSMSARYGADWANWWPENTRPSLAEFTIWAWDGHYFRGVFTVFCDPSVLGYAGKAMEEWNSGGGNSYKTEAVFAAVKHNGGDLELIRLKGHDVADKRSKFVYSSFNSNPGNDDFFCRNLQGRLDDLAHEWGFGPAAPEPEPEQRQWHRPESDVDGPVKWKDYGDSFTAESKFGVYHIDSIFRNGKKLGYRVKFANGGKGAKLPNQGLWHEVTMDGKSLFGTVQSAKKAARKHHEEIS